MAFTAHEMVNPADDSLNVVSWETLGGVMLLDNAKTERRIRIKILGRMNDGSDEPGTGTEIELWIDLDRAARFAMDLASTARITRSYPT